MTGKHRQKRSSLSLRDDIPRLRQLFTLVPWRMRWRVVVLLFAGLLAALLDIASVAAILPLTQMMTSADNVLPGFAKRFIIPVIRTEDRQTILLVLATFIGVTFLVKNVAMIAIRWWSIGVTMKASAAVQTEALRRYLASSYASHRARSKATILQTISGAIPGAFTSVMLGYISLTVDGMTVALLFLTLMVVSPLGSAVAIVVYGGAALLMIRFLKPWALRFAIRSLDLNTEAWGYLNPAIEGFRESRIFQREQLFESVYRANRREYAHVSRGQQMLGEMPKYVMEVVMIFGIIAVAVILFLTMPESSAFGILAVFAAAALRIAPALNRMVATVNGIRSGSTSLRLVTDQIDELRNDDTMSDGQDVRAIDDFHGGDIVVRDLGFHYVDSHTPALTDVNVVIPEGSTVALVGPSGAGKTTFADLLVGLLKPTHGTITVNGFDTAASPETWMRKIAMVSQKIYLWDATLRDLITFGQPRGEVNEALLTDVVRRARLDDMVASLRDGLDTRVGDSGARVSGGQAQRIGIARALYHKPSILVLDEATSALDNETEHEITATIEALHGQITVIVIAHRLSTVKHSDEILFFSNGRLKAQGNMRNLAMLDEEFARLVELGSLT